MHPIITQALLISLQTLSQPAMHTAHQRLRTQLLIHNPSLQMLLDLLANNPNDEDTQQFVARQLHKTEIAQENELLLLAQDLLRQIETPAARMLGVDLHNLTIGKDLHIDDITSSGDGVILSDSNIQGTVKLSAIQSGNQHSAPTTANTLITGNTITGDLILDPSIAALDAAEQRYLHGLYAECNELPLANQGPVDASRPRQPRLQNVYVDLSTPMNGGLALVKYRLRLSPEQCDYLDHTLNEMEGVARQISDSVEGGYERGIATSDLEQIDKAFGFEKDTISKALLTAMTTFEAIHFNRQLVLLGEPGGGKSTLTRRLAGILASQIHTDLTPDEQEWLAQVKQTLGVWLLPIRITFSHWASHISPTAEGNADDLIDECVRQIAQTADLPSLKQRLVKRIAAQHPAVLLLLDGLDEVADESQRSLLLKSLRHFCERYTNTPLIITCRIRPWDAWKAQGEQPNLPVFTIDKLSDQAIQRFVERWHNELLHAGIYQPAAAQLAQDRLLTAIHDPTRTDLADMAGTPLLLTMMARVNYEQGLPDSRAELYDLYMRQLLWEWERTKLDEKGQPTSLEILLRTGNVDKSSLERKLSQLAYDVHASKGNRDTVDIPRSTLRDALESIYPGNDKAAQAAWAVNMLDLLDDRTGLLRSLDHNRYQFTHRTFQEYLAARWLATGDYLKKFKEKIDHDQWGEVISLALGHQSRVQKQYEDALTVLFNLFPKTATSSADWRRVLLLGQAYVRLLGPQKARESEQTEIADILVQRIPTLLTAALQNPALPLPQRQEAGLLLTRGVTDPASAGLDIDPPQLDHFIQIPVAGLPKNTLRIAKYPVTNKQYKRFIDAGGYANQTWWSKEGWAAREGNNWTLPRYWNDPSFNRLSQPVVGVSWYEANAYCAWLTQQLHQTQSIAGQEMVRLPTEQEWMQAAHADQHPYPWGPTFDPTRANTTEGGIRETTPVHMYKNGTTPEEVYDLSGNVWEWSNDREDDKYPYRKGGSWYQTSRATSARYVNVDPLSWFNDFGFRCVVVPISLVLAAGS